MCISWLKRSLELQRFLRIFGRGQEFDDDFLACLDVRSTIHETRRALRAHEPYMLVSLYLWHLF